MKPWPGITVITPTYNSGPFLAETIESVLNQDVPGLEYMIFDGGSTDDTVDVIRRYEKHLTFWVSEKDGGQAAAVNRGFARATTEFVAELDSDDLYLPGALHAALDVLRSTPGARWVAGGILDFGTAHTPQHSWYLPTVPTTLLDVLTQRFQVAQPGHVWSRAMIAAVGGYDTSMRYVFDNDLYAKLLINGERCIAINRPLAAYRLHPTSKTMAEGQYFEAEWDRIRARCVPLLPPHERVIYRHRVAMLRSQSSYTTAARELAEGSPADARARFARTIASYPPSLLSRAGLGCARRLLFGSRPVR